MSTDNEHALGGACRCPEGLLLSESDVCLPAEECPCHHNHENYETGSKIVQHGCLDCECFEGQWKCIPDRCPGVAVLTGFSHMVSFDEVDFDLHGMCDYVLVMDKADEEGHRDFYIVITVEPCTADAKTFCVRAWQFHFHLGHRVLAPSDES